MSHVKRDDADVLRITEDAVSYVITIKADGKSTLTRREANTKPVNAIAVRYMQQLYRVETATGGY